MNIYLQRSKIEAVNSAVKKRYGIVPTKRRILLSKIKLLHKVEDYYPNL